MYKDIKNGWDLIKESIKVFCKYPKFILPLLFTWIVYAPIVLYFGYGFKPDLYTQKQIFIIVFMVIFVTSFFLVFSCSMLLEFIQQIESGRELSFIDSFKDTCKSNLLKLLPLVFIWSVVQFIFLIIQSLFSKDKKDQNRSLNLENAAKTLSGSSKFSFSSFTFKILEKTVRMVVFLILPAVAWDNLPFRKAVKKGFSVIGKHPSEFLAGFVLTGISSAIIFAPLALLYIVSEGAVAIPKYVWIISIIYSSFAWSYSIYLEQMFIAYLYLWDTKWEEEILKAQKEGRVIPDFKNYPIPSILDSTNDLINKNVSF